MKVKHDTFKTFNVQISLIDIQNFIFELLSVHCSAIESQKFKALKMLISSIDKSKDEIMKFLI